MNIIEIENIVELYGKCIFVSDTHFQTPQDTDSEKRENMLLRMLKQQEPYNNLFLLGDIFDFWFEYKDVVPKGYFNLFSYLQSQHQQGVKIHFFAGNHDMWVQNYFSQTFGAIIYRKEQLFTINNRQFLIAHGDGLGGNQRKYHLIKNILNFNPNRVLYSMLHPRIAFSAARFFSGKSRNSHSKDDESFHYESEYQVMYARNVLKHKHIDFFVFGHRHIPTEYELQSDSMFFNTGDWLKNFSFITYESSNQKPKLVFFNS